jgi:hypothetical protein
LLGLLLLCLVPRALMAWKLQGLCPDGVAYIHLAQLLDQGQGQEFLRLAKLNPLPVVLVVLHRAGLDWELAGSLWSVLMAAAVVLPLFGWLRRQFDRRVALAGCFLYAVHAELIRWSPEILRDPTFWFLFTLGLYLLWRAVTEVRLGLFLSAGAVILLASVTRFEGLLLLVPAAGWSVARWRVLPSGRARLAIGALACLGAVPAAAALLLLGAAGQGAAELIRVQPLMLAGGWAQSLAAPVLGEPSGPTSALLKSFGPISLGRMWEIYLPTVAKGLTLLWAALWAMGAAFRRWRPAPRLAWSPREHFPLVIAQAVLLLAIWVHLGVQHSSCRRYVFPVVLMGSGLAALGLLRVSALAGQWAARLRPQWRGLFAAAPAIMVGAVALAAAFSWDCGPRTARVALGRWLRDQAGPAPVLLGPQGFTEVVNYYARGRCTSFAPTAGAGTVRFLFTQSRPNVVLLPRDEALSSDKAVLRFLAAAGLRPLECRRLPASVAGVSVWMPARPAAGAGTVPLVVAEGRDQGAIPFARSDLELTDRVPRRGSP